MRLGTAASPRPRTPRQGDLALPRLKPLAQIIALMVLASGVQAAPQAFSSAWFAAKGSAPVASGAGGQGGAVQLPGLPPPLAQQQRANAQLQRSLHNLNNTVTAIAAQQAAQAAGRAAALAAPQTIHNGLGGNGLNPLLDANGKPLFVNADGPQQTQQGGTTQVSIRQTADKAILNWETFNVGRDTQLNFQQNADWALLNRVGNSVAPSQIQGTIKADGTVMIVNQNGIVFSGSSQVNVRNLVAAAATISDAQFRDGGLYVDSAGSLPTVTDAAGKVLVQQGAVLQSKAPASSTQGGGYTLLLGSEVENAGTLINHKGQATLAAGDSFYIRKGVSTAGNLYSTTRGNEVATTLKPGSAAGLARNSGLIQAGQGDITLTGHRVEQAGVAVASSSVDNRGTVHLLNAASDGKGSVTLAQGSTTAIVIDAEAGSALDSQRDALRKDMGGQVNQRTGVFDNLSGAADDRSLSRVEIVSGGTVEFQPGSLTLATGGQVAVSAGQRSLLRDGAVVDVAGAVGVQLAMDSNNIKVNIQGNELRDAAGNRDGSALKSIDAWLDIRELVKVATGVNGYEGERWYTAGGLLEVGGYLGTRSHSLGEWLAQGGTVDFSGGDLVSEAGSLINLSGGTLDVQSGQLKMTWLRGSDGRLYDINRAPGDLLYQGVYQGYEQHSERWGQTAYFYNPLIAPRERLANGYTVGRDAGRLVVGTANAQLGGEILGETFQGNQQLKAPQAGLDGYRQAQGSQARGAQLIAGYYVPTASGSTLTATAGNLKQVVIGRQAAGEAGMALDAAVAPEREGVLLLDVERLQGYALGGLHLAAYEGIQVDQALTLVDGAGLSLLAPRVNINADLTSHGGRMTLGNLQAGSPTLAVGNTARAAELIVAAGVRVDAGGRRQDGANANAAQVSPWLDGGSLVLHGSGDIRLGEGSLLRVDAGAAQLPQGTWRGGAGGSISLASIGLSGTAGGTLSLGGELHGYGSSGAGTLTLRGDQVSIGAPSATASLSLGDDFFDKGFARYEVTGTRTLTVAEGAQVVVGRPVYRLRGDAGSADQALALWTPPQYLEDPAAGVLSQRQGASLLLQAGTGQERADELPSRKLEVGRDSRIVVDDGQAITLRSPGGMQVDGSLIAHGGQITLAERVPLNNELTSASNDLPHQRAIRLGSTANLDVSARGVTFVDALGARYGQVRQGGSIVIGSGFDPQKGGAIAPDLFVVVEAGARLDASGSQISVDVPGVGATQLASAGGSISLASDNGLYLDGNLRAASGGAGAAAGSLTVALESATALLNDANAAANRQRELRIGALPETFANQAGDLVYGHGHLSVEQIRQGAFDDVTLFSRGVISFTDSLTLNLAGSLSLYAGALALAEGADAASQVNLAAAQVRLSGYTPLPTPAPGATNNELGLTLSNRDDQALLRVDGGLIELRNSLKVGTSGVGIGAQDRRGFSTVELNSSGDLRLLKHIGGTDTRLTAPDELTLGAAQIYPGTNAVAVLQAKHIELTRTTSATPQQPYSLFGNLSLLAETIDQRGVLRAPLGGLILGNANTREVTLHPGSLTSISAAGLQMPYGGTVDGLVYTANGKALSDSVLSDSPPNGWLNVTLGGGSIAVAEGAVIDLSGGGQVQGAGFVSGRGGSTDARYHPLVQNNPDGSFTLPTLSSNPVYAIVPGAQPSVAPPLLDGEGGSQPLVGQRITLDAGVPGLPAGTYTLMPASYALLPGAYRVELNGLASAGASRSTAMALRNGSWSLTGKRSIAGTQVVDALAQQLVLSSADNLRRYAQYNETSFSQFLVDDAARLGIPRAALPIDAKGLTLDLGYNKTDRPTFSMDGLLLNKAQGQGQGSIVSVLFPDTLLIHGEQPPTSLTTTQTAISAQHLNRLQATSLRIGTAGRRIYGQGGNQLLLNASGRNIVLGSGAQLQAGEVILATGYSDGGITVEQGARIDTLKQGKPAYDSTDGYLYNPQSNSVLIVSNGWVDVLAPTPSTEVRGPGRIVIGGCLSQCSGQTELYSEGTIAAATTNRFALDDQVRFGTRNLTLAVGAINVGSAQQLADAAAAGYLPSGLTLNQQVLDRLLQGDTQRGAPALENLTFTVRDSINFFGSSNLDTLDPVTGKSRMANLVLGTPAIYGLGSADDVASIRTGNLIWSGATQAAPALLAHGAGTGSGRLQLQAERIELGYGPQSQPSSQLAFGRLALGFAGVELLASERVTANHRGSLAVYQQQGEYVTGEGYRYSGGNLLIQAPLLTGEAGAVNQVRAGGRLQLLGSPGQAVAPVSLKADALGAEWSFSAPSITLDTRVALPSGKLTLDSQGDLLLGSGAQLDLAGRKVTLNDLAKYSWGGDVILRSRQGNVLQAAGSVIDLHAEHNRGGSLEVVALDAAAGQVDLLGRILGSSSGHYDAGGTLVPYAGAGINLRALRLGGGDLSQAFATLNQTLNDGGLLGSRRFQFKQGDLSIGDGLRANDVQVSLDNGHLQVTGLIDASGERVGSIRLAANKGLTLASGALLDAHGRVLRVDSYGKIIDSPNRATVELNSGAGQLTLASGARIDLRHGTDALRGTGAGQHDGVERGTLALYAPRLRADDPTYGDIAIDAAGPLEIVGAKRIDLFAMARDHDAPLGTDGHVSGKDYVQVDKAYLDARHDQSTLFMTAALHNSALRDGKLAGLTQGYREQFHLRPGLEVITDGDLVVSGDLDLSGYRYASLNPNVALRDGVVGSGEAGSLSLRAGGDVQVLGSINDGFAPPVATQDDGGWRLLEGRLAYGAQVVVPNGGVELHAGTGFLAGQVLNYDVPIQARQMVAGTVLPVRATLAQPVTLPAGTVLAAPVYNADGSQALAAGSRLETAVQLTAGMQLGAGSQLVVDTPITAMTWPKGVPLPAQPRSQLVFGADDLVLLSQNLVLQRGAIIPPRTDIQLGGAGSVALRPEGKGQNWAVARMLPAGSESWNLRLVAGADTTAADPRLTDPQATGQLRLADHHIGMKAVGASSGWVWTQEGLDGFGWTGNPGDPIDFDAIGYPSLCEEYPTWCAKAPPASGWVWTQEGLDGFGWTGNPGDSIDFDAIGYPTLCEEYPTWCAKAPAGGDYDLVPTASSRFSVLRTGMGDLDLIAAGNLDMTTLFGVYTAGTATEVPAAYQLPRGVGASGQVLPEVLGGYGALVAGDDRSYQAWYPEQGGNLLLQVGGDLKGNALSREYKASELAYQLPSAQMGNWLWRQGSGTALTGDQAIATAWWINFGTYVDFERNAVLAGFTGFGTLGGGNLDVRVAGQAGVLDVVGNTSSEGRDQWGDSARSQGLQLAVGSTGRVNADGSLTLGGGGDLNLKVGGALNPTRAASGHAGQAELLGSPAHDLQGTLSNLRGNLQVSAAALGGISRIYGAMGVQQDDHESRAYDPFHSTLASAYGGLVVIPGDATVQLSTRGDLVLGGAADPGRVPAFNTTPFAGLDGGGRSWFSLWTANTAIDLFSAGGDLTPSTQVMDVKDGGPLRGLDTSPTDGRFVYPSIFRAVAASGNLYYGNFANAQRARYDSPVEPYSLLLAPSANAELQLVAQGSIYAGGYVISQSGAAQSALATPFNPAFIGAYNGVSVTNQRADGILANVEQQRFPLFAFAGTGAANAYGQLQPARIYAATGDLVGVRSGEMLDFGNARNGALWYEGAAPVWMMAGRDIVNSGTALGERTQVPSDLSDVLSAVVTSTGNLFVHNAATDHSQVMAGRDILFSSFNVAGPGTLTVSAGRNLRLEDRAAITSLGAIVTGDNRPGASLVLQAGVGSSGPDYSRFAAQYLNPANLADSSASLASQPGKVAKTYAEELRLWLAERYGFEGTAEQARERFAGLPATEQGVFARAVYFAELREGGREYNQAGGVRQGSYLRGRNAIAALFPERDVAGNAIRYDGDILMFGGAGIRTQVGGGIQVLTPGGQQVFGVEGLAPPSSAGVITQGSGDIQLYAKGSILLGQSRIMTTFGGSIMGWSAEGDINAGRGSKTTVLYTPPRRLYDNWGNSSLSPSVPSTGAGIATLAPVVEVPPGDIDLIAPLGTIDAGEAGIRVSGNVNIAALQVVNAANIQVQGEAKGVPVVASVNTGAITSASAAANSATQAAADATRQQQAAARDRQPSIITVQVVGNGNERLVPARKGASVTPRYNGQSPVQVLGAGTLDEQARAQLTEEERGNLM
ncbi:MULTISPECIES: filamentous haemagglutinin family protein [Pseudomonas]|uniref:filamentous haemagglutinin family protein n=1 Tax=Pseudomonas TaxID=286 RepID=UPI001E298389|nr:MULTISPECIES: filamentous haemagglutinin family protein [Pseudomonas]MCE1117219.1 filamentous hemagglutinin family protein [Pseudomonas sp. NMI795_08]